MSGDLTPKDLADIDRLNPPQAERIAKASEMTKPLDAARLKEELTACREASARTYAELKNAQRDVERLKALEDENRKLREHLDDLRTLIRRLD